MPVVTYHGKEETKLWVEFDLVSVSEDKLLLAVLLGSENNVDLLGSHRQHRQLDTVELVKAAPRPRLGKA